MNNSTEQFQGTAELSPIDDHPQIYALFRNGPRALRRIVKSFDDPFLQTMTRYDQLAAMLGRKRYAPVNESYNFQAQQDRKRLEDRAELAREISQVVNENSVYELYSYIYESEELDWLVETRNCGYSSLRTHLLIGANMIVQAYQQGYLNSLIGSSAQES